MRPPLPRRGDREMTQRRTVVVSLQIELPNQHCVALKPVASRSGPPATRPGSYSSWMAITFCGGAKPLGGRRTRRDDFPFRFRATRVGLTLALCGAIIQEASCGCRSGPAAGSRYPWSFQHWARMQSREFYLLTAAFNNFRLPRRINGTGQRNLPPLTRYSMIIATQVSIDNLGADEEASLSAINELIEDDVSHAAAAA